MLDDLRALFATQVKCIATDDPRLKIGDEPPPRRRARACEVGKGKIHAGEIVSCAMNARRKSASILMTDRRDPHGEREKMVFGEFLKAAPSIAPRCAFMVQIR